MTKKTRFLRGSTLEAHSAQAPMANSMAPIPSNSSQTEFASVLHLYNWKSDQVRYHSLSFYILQVFLNEKLDALPYLQKLNWALSPPQVGIEN